VADKKPSDHRHCVVCGQAIPAGERFCSEEHQQTMEGQRKRQQRSMWIFLGILAVFMVLIYFTGGQTGCFGAPTS
jgi:predicted nucleic acid-binding Zn ribbon protein